MTIRRVDNDFLLCKVRHEICTNAGFADAWYTLAQWLHEPTILETDDIMIMVAFDEKDAKNPLKGILIYTVEQDAVVINMLFVNLNHRKQGIGRTLVQSLRTDTIVGVSAEANHNSLCFWFSCGFWVNHVPRTVSKAFHIWLLHVPRTESDIYQKAMDLEIPIDDTLSLIKIKK